MKIRKNRAITYEEKEEPVIQNYIINCEECESELEVSEEDLKVGKLGCKYVVCPCCGKETYNEEFGSITLTKNNLSFPKHYTRFGGEDCVKIQDKEIDSWVRRCIGEIQKYNKDYSYYYIGSGDTIVIVFNHCDDGEYMVLVCKNYYETYVPMEEE